jgi:hypothetical protein
MNVFNHISGLIQQSPIATCKVAYGQFSISEVDDISVFSPYILIYDVGHSHKGYCRRAAC